MRSFVRKDGEDGTNWLVSDEELPLPSFAFIGSSGFSSHGIKTWLDPVDLS